MTPRTLIQDSYSPMTTCSTVPCSGFCLGRRVRFDLLHPDQKSNSPVRVHWQVSRFGLSPIPVPYQVRLPNLSGPSNVTMWSILTRILLKEHRVMENIVKRTVYSWLSIYEEGSDPYRNHCWPLVRTQRVHWGFQEKSLDYESLDLLFSNKIMCLLFNRNCK